MAGMVKEPVAKTLATDDPEIVPNMAEETTSTLAGPPACRPATFMPRLWKSMPTPEPSMKAPKMMNIATIVAEMPVIEP